MRPAILFQFRADVSPERQTALLDRIGGWNGIIAAARLAPQTGPPDVRRMCHAYAEADADLAAVIERLSALPEVESASIPARRCLI